MECTVPLEVRLATEHADVCSLERTVSAAVAEVAMVLCSRAGARTLVLFGYAVTRSPDAADFSMAAMTSWRRTASAKSGTA